MSALQKQILWSIVRHALTTIGGAAVAQGTLSGSDLDVVIGAIGSIAGVVWSIIEKHQKAKVPVASS